MATSSFLNQWEATIASIAKQNHSIAQGIHLQAKCFNAMTNPLFCCSRKQSEMCKACVEIVTLTRSSQPKNISGH